VVNVNILSSVNRNDANITGWIFLSNCIELFQHEYRTPAESYSDIRADRVEINWAEQSALGLMTSNLSLNEGTVGASISIFLRDRL